MTSAIQPQPDFDEAVRFLEALRPRGPWVLTAIPPERGKTFTDTLDAAADVKAWLAKHNGSRNCYFMVNPARGPLESKAKKEDVEELATLHVDVDPEKRDGLSHAEKLAWLASERTRILCALQDFKPKPSAIIDSGGGFQGFWFLRDGERLFVGGDANRISDGEEYNRGLEVALGGDHCWNIDRIMRLPGAINIPDDKKRKRGRVEALAKIVSLDAEEYGLADFTPVADPAARKRDGNKDAQTSVLPADLPRADLEKLPAHLAPFVRMLIVQGDDPDDPQRYKSKSEAMWHVLHELIRVGCDDQFIATILLDPDLGISDHPLRQKRSHEYVARQIERAREEAANPLLQQMNADHAVIELYGGKCRVVSWQPSEADRKRLELVALSFEDFRNRYMNIRVKVGETKEGNPVYSTAGKWWLENPQRAQYRTVVFSPDGNSDPGDLNLWRGLAVTPRAGEWPLLRELIETVLAGGDRSGADYILRWSAFAVQHPECPAEVALTFIGGKWNRENR